MVAGMPRPTSNVGSVHDASQHALQYGLPRRLRRLPQRGRLMRRHRRFTLHCGPMYRRRQFVRRCCPMRRFRNAAPSCAATRWSRRSMAFLGFSPCGAFFRRGPTMLSCLGRPADGAAPRCLAPPPEDAATDVTQEQLLQRVAQPPHGRRERQPLDRDDVLHDVTARPLVRLHAPELHDLRPAACAIGDGAEKFVNFNTVPGLLDGFAPRAGRGIFISLELTARQHPGIIFAALDNSNARLRAAAHHDTPRRMNRPRHIRSTHFPPHLM